MSSTAADHPTAPADEVRTLRVAVVNDYGVIVAGLRALLDDEARVDVVEATVDLPLQAPADLVLYDTFGQPEADLARLHRILDDPAAGHVAVFSWHADAESIDEALAAGAHGFLSKGAPIEQLVDAFRRIVAGEVVVHTGWDGASRDPALGWPGREHDLSEREAEVMALITQGKTNTEISDLLHLSINTVKTYIRSAYRKAGVTRRVQAVIWGRDHGFAPEAAHGGDGPS